MRDLQSTKFEMSFMAGFKYWVRVFDVREDKSIIHQQCPQKWECYEPHPDGEFSSVYAPEERFKRVFGKSSFARSRVCPVSPVDAVIRDDYRNNFNLKPRIMYLDIETRTGTVSSGFPRPDKALEPVSLIQFLDSKTGVVHVIGDKEFYFMEHYLSLPAHHGTEVIYHACRSEEEMFEKFFTFIEELCPAVVYAWNGSGFDFPYLYNRAKRLRLRTEKFSPFWRQLPDDCVEGREQTFGNLYTMELTVPGVHYLDIKRLYQKLVLAPRQSYSLENIAMVELGVGKIDHSEFVTFEDFYQGNYSPPARPTPEQKETLCYKLFQRGANPETIKKAGHGQFVYYGVIDVVRLQDIDLKCGLSGKMAKTTEKMNSNYHTILGTTKSWGNYIRNQMFDLKIIIDTSVLNVDLEKSITGGFVRTPVPGKQRWVISEDVKSMYPLLSLTGSNMSPETFRPTSAVPPELRDFAIRYLKAGTPAEQNENNLLNIIHDNKIRTELRAALKKHNLSMAPNGVFFSKDNLGILPRLVLDISDERDKVKGEMFKHEQDMIEIEAELNRRAAVQ